MENAEISLGGTLKSLWVDANFQWWSRNSLRGDAPAPPPPYNLSIGYNLLSHGPLKSLSAQSKTRHLS